MTNPDKPSKGQIRNEELKSTACPPVWRPPYVEYLPCYHRWQRYEGVPPFDPFTPAYWELEHNERINDLSMPLRRNMIWLWINFSRSMEPKRKEGLKKLLIEYYKLDPCDLEEVIKLQEQREKLFSEAGPFDVIDKQAALLKAAGDRKLFVKHGKGDGRGGVSRQGEAEGVSRQGGAGGVSRQGGAGGVGGLGGREEEGYIGQGGGQGKMGGGGGTGEGGNTGQGGEEQGDGQRGQGRRGRKSNGKALQRKGKMKFKTTSEAISNIRFIAHQLLSGGPDEHYISQAPEYFDVQATVILDMACKILEMPPPHQTWPSKNGIYIALACMNIAVLIAKNVTAPAVEIPDEKVEEFLALRGKTPEAKKRKGKKDKGGKKGKKGKKDKRKGKKVAKMVKEEDDFLVPTTAEKSWGFKDYPCKDPKKLRILQQDAEPNGTEFLKLIVVPSTSETEEDMCQPMSAKELFTHSYIWYNPEIPEFMYNGKRHFPDEIFNFQERHGIDKTWFIPGIRTGTQNLVPEVVPTYYSILRPLRLCSMERDEILPQPWYIMSTPYTYDPIQTDFYYWGCPEMVEQIEILLEIYNVATTVPNISIGYLVEMLRKYKEAVDCAAKDLGDVTGYVKTIRKKFQIIIERIVMNSIGPIISNYSEEGIELIELVCSQVALYINLLYSQTARDLWELQSSGVRTPSTRPPSPEPEDDYEMTEAWNDWLDWLKQVAEVGEQWAAWLGPEAEAARNGVPADVIEELKEIADGHCMAASGLLNDADQYLNKARSLESLHYRKFKTSLHDDKWVDKPLPNYASSTDVSEYSGIEK